jgi:glucokinase
VYASGTGLAARAASALRRRGRTDLAGTLIKEVTGRTVAEAAAAGDPLAAKLMHDAAHALARGIAGVANLLDLDRVVIGGGVAQSGELLFTPLRAELKRRARLSFSRDLEIRQASLGTEAGVVGAAGLVFQQHAHT